MKNLDNPNDYDKRGSVALANIMQGGKDPFFLSSFEVARKSNTAATAKNRLLKSNLSVRGKREFY